YPSAHHLALAGAIVTPSHLAVGFRCSRALVVTRSPSHRRVRSTCDRRDARLLARASNTQRITLLVVPPPRRRRATSSAQPLRTRGRKRVVQCCRNGARERPARVLWHRQLLDACNQEDIDEADRFSSHMG